MPFTNAKERLFIRPARVNDISAIIDLSNRAYAGTGMHGYTVAPLNGQITTFPEGQFVAVLGDRTVGYCATFLISGKVALAPHDWTSITGNGFASRHDPNGYWLFGMGVCVDPG